MATDSQAGAYIQIDGVQVVQDYLDSVKEGAGRAGREVVVVGSPLVYAFGIETGRHRGGRLARRAGGAFYLREAYQTVQPRIASTVADVIDQGGDATLRALLGLGYDMQREAQNRVPVRTGTLRRSIHTATRAG
jgi:hypothetical protein